MNASRIILLAFLLVATGAGALWWHNKSDKTSAEATSNTQSAAQDKPKGLCNPTLRGTQDCLKCCTERFDAKTEPADLHNCVEECTNEQPSNVGD